MKTRSRQVIENVDVVHPFGATLYGDEIFWTDWGRKSVEAIHKNGKGPFTFLYVSKMLVVLIPPSPLRPAS